MATENNIKGFNSYSEEILEEERIWKSYTDRRLVSPATVLQGAVYRVYDDNGKFMGIEQGEPLKGTKAEIRAAKKKLEKEKTSKNQVKTDVTLPTTYTVMGVTYDSATGQPISGVTASSDSSSDSSSSSVSGTYTVNGITYDVATGRPISGVTGGSTTKIFNETSEIPKFPKNPPPPQELTRQQLKAYRTLIRDNPQDEQWQQKIAELKNKYPRLANEQNFTQQQLDNLSESEYEAYTNRLEKYSKAGFPNVQPVSPSTGKEVLTADPCKGNFIDEVETQLGNFIDLVS